MSDSKTYVFNPESTSGNTAAMLAPLLSRGMDSTTLAALMNNGGFGGNNMWIIFLFFLMGWGGNGFGNGRGFDISAQLNDNTNRELLSQAIHGNSNAVTQLANNLHVDVSQIQTALNSVMSGVQNVANQVGMTGQQVINAIQSGNASIAASMAQNCCDIKNAITTQGYENRIANIEQTNILGSKIDNQTNIINEHFAQMEMRELQAKLDYQREENTALKNQISNLNQNAVISQMIANATGPMQASLACVTSEVDSIRKAINPVVVPYGPYGPYGPYSNGGSIWS